MFDYFDAPVLGLTATPTDRALEVFQGNLVSSYTFEQAVADGRAVDVTIYRIGDLPTRSERAADTLQEEFDLDVGEPLGHRRSVVSGKALHAALTAFKEGLPSMFPERARLGSGDVALPKTVVYAANDQHADEVVDAVRAVFGQGPGFCQKVTLKGGSPYRLLRSSVTPSNCESSSSWIYLPGRTSPPSNACCSCGTSSPHITSSRCSRSGRALSRRRN
nr:hypothetical protein [Streptomyces lasalocidi]